MDPFQRTATNQTPPLTGHDVIATDQALTEAIDAVAGPESAGVTASLGTLGSLAGSEAAREHALLANRHTPELVAVDRWGNRVDEVRFHPSWHWLLDQGVRSGLQAAPWTSPESLPHLRRAAGFYAWAHVESGNGCPLSMTYAAVPALRVDEVIAKEWVPGLGSTTYEFGLAPAESKADSLRGWA